MFIGINLLTFALDDDTALKTIEDAESEFNIPVTDLIRFGERDLIDAIEKLL